MSPINQALVRGEGLTITADAAGGVCRPQAQRGAGDGGGPVGQVAWVTAVLQHGAHRDGASGRLCQVDGAVLNQEGPHTSWERKQHPAQY